MDHKNWHKFPVLFSLYIAQSIPMSFFSTVVPVIMRQENYSLQSIGLLQLVKLPWILKFLWAPMVDNNTKNTAQLKRWILTSEFIYAGLIIGIGFFNLQTDFTLIVGMMVLAFTASATQDIAVDIFAIFVLRKNERSLGNSMQASGSFVGSLVGTGILLILYYHFGWSNLLLFLAVFVVLAVSPIFFHKNSLPLEKKTQKVTFLEIGRFFRGKGQHKNILILLFYNAGIIGILSMLKPYMVDLGYNIKEIGIISGIFGTAMATLMSFLGGFIIKKIGRTNSMFLFAVSNLITASYFLTMSNLDPNYAMLIIGVGMIWSTYGLSTVIIYTSAMDNVRQGREGTDFTLQIVLLHLSSLILAIGSGKLGDALGYQGIYTMEVILCIVSIGILLYALNRKKLKNSD